MSVPRLVTVFCLALISVGVSIPSLVILAILAGANVCAGRFRDDAISGVPGRAPCVEARAHDLLQRSAWKGNSPMLEVTPSLSEGAGAITLPAPYDQIRSNGSGLHHCQQRDAPSCTP